MWSVLTGEVDRATSFEDLRARYEVDAAALEADLLRFADRCAAEGLLVPAAGPPAAGLGVRAAPSGAPRWRRPGVLRALRCLIATRLAIARHGAPATYARYALLPAGAAVGGPGGAVTAFRRAENLYTARGAPDDCLPRSLALFRFLRESGLPAEHVIGVRRRPFQAHAWVECEGPRCSTTAPPPTRRWRGWTPRPPRRGSHEPLRRPARP